MAPAASRTKGRKRSVGTASSKKKKKTKTKQQTEEVVCVSDDDCVISPIVILKQMYDMKRYEESEECFILDFDPYEAADLVNGKVASARKIDEDVVLVSEKGQVACRDYPHPRHLCLKFPFHSTKHESYCKLCYCYVCDTAAPCKYWLHPGPGHCHASDRIIEWKQRRELSKLSAGMKTS